MPRGPDGSYTLPVGTIVASGDTLLPSQHNPAMTDIAASLTNSLSRNGLGNMQADLDMGGFDITNIGAIAGYALLAGAAFTGSVSVAGDVTTTGGNRRIKITHAGSGAQGGIGFSNQDVNRSGFIELFSPTGVRVGYIGYVPITANPPIEYNNEAGGKHAFNSGLTVGGFNVAHGTRSNIFISDGTGTPSGGVDGDLYFQYT